METPPTIPSPLSYLVVEDAPDVCEGIIRRMQPFTRWRTLGYTLSVGAALDAIRTHRPALLFLDWELAGGNAFAILEAVQNMPGYDPYTVFFTGYQSDEPQIPERVINDFGVDKYLVKPIWEKLRLQLSQFLAEAEARAALTVTVPEKKVWLSDAAGSKHFLDLRQLICIVQHPLQARWRQFYFATRPVPYDIPVGWQEVIDLLTQQQIDFFVTKSRSHIVTRNFMERYERPYVRLRGLNLKFEVVAEKHHAFEQWLKSKS